jgi:hypothetical protein
MTGGSFFLDLRVETQSVANWCWAEVASAITRYLDRSTLNACRLASMVHDCDCCETPDSRKCAREFHVRDAMERYTRNLREEIHGRGGHMLTGDLVRQELAAGYPICLRLTWRLAPRNALRHTVIVRGIDGDVVNVADPYFGYTLIDLEDLNNDYGMARGKIDAVYLTKRASE